MVTPPASTMSDSLVEEALHPHVDRHQGRRAGGLDVDRRAVEVEQVRHPGDQEVLVVARCAGRGRTRPSPSGPGSSSGCTSCRRCDRTLRRSPIGAVVAGSGRSRRAQGPPTTPRGSDGAAGSMMAASRGLKPKNEASKSLTPARGAPIAHVAGVVESRRRCTPARPELVVGLDGSRTDSTPSRRLGPVTGRGRWRRGPGGPCRRWPPRSPSIRRSCSPSSPHRSPSKSGPS